MSKRQNTVPMSWQMRVLFSAVSVLVACGPTRRSDVLFGETDARTDASDGGYDPFSAGNHCASSTIPTNRVPGTLMIVLDYSGSMTQDVGTTSDSRWELAARAVRNVVDALPDEMRVGLVRFPSSSCTVPTAPTVAIGPLSTTRAMIRAQVDPSRPPSASNLTPIVRATDLAAALLEQAPAMGGRGLLVVTDGQETCEGSRSSAISAAQRRLQASNIKTYVVGLEVGGGFLSQLAGAGGTGPAHCDPDCPEPTSSSADSCYDDSDCYGASRCLSAGYCSCVRQSDCGSGQQCNTTTGECESQGGGTCCNYAVGAANFTRDFGLALEEVSNGFRGDCTFAVPTTMANFDPDAVNVGVTFQGQPRVVVPRSDNAMITAWHYTDSTNTTLQVTGPLCQQMRMMDASVEIVVGCPSVLP